MPDDHKALVSAITNGEYELVETTVSAVRANIDGAPEGEVFADELDRALDEAQAEVFGESAQLAVIVIVIRP